jgi:hypothetical protein
VPTAYYFDSVYPHHIILKSWCQLHIILAFCVTAYYLDKWCQQHIALTLLVQQHIIVTVSDKSILFRLSVPAAYYFDCWLQQHIIYDGWGQQLSILTVVSRAYYFFSFVNTVYYLTSRAQYFYILCQQHIIFPVVVYSLLFWKLISSALTVVPIA